MPRAPRWLATPLPLVTMIVAASPRSADTRLFTGDLGEARAHRISADTGLFVIPARTVVVFIAPAPVIGPPAWAAQTAPAPPQPAAAAAPAASVAWRLGPLHRAARCPGSSAPPPWWPPLHRACAAATRSTDDDH